MMEPIARYLTDDHVRLDALQDGSCDPTPPA